MKLSELSKERKQYILLGLLVAAGAVALVVFGARSSLSSISSAKQELDDLSKKIEQADSLLRRRTQIEADFAATTRELRACMEEMPPTKNYYSWATEILYSLGREIGLEIETIDEMDASARQSALDKKGGGSTSAVELDAYSLRINSMGSYQNVIDFLASLRARHPLVRVTGLDIGAGAVPEKHTVQIFVQWPFPPAALEGLWDSIPVGKAVAAPPPADSQASAMTPNGSVTNIPSTDSHAPAATPDSSVASNNTPPADSQAPTMAPDAPEASNAPPPDNNTDRKTRPMRSKKRK